LVLVAHSLGCILVAAWAAHSRNTHRVLAALLVAPGDPEREELRAVLKSWSPVVLQALPFKSTLVGSHNDPFCSSERARQFADAWGANFVDYGATGHINADSGLGDWPEGLALLEPLMNLKKVS
jgi:predicted alpha/beta hydrolase family esterase